MSEKSKNKYKERIFNLLRDSSNPKYKRSYTYILKNINPIKYDLNRSEETRSIEFLNFVNNFEKALDELVSENKLIKIREANDDWYIYNEHPKLIK